MNHGLFFFGGGTPCSPSNVLSADGHLRKISIFNVPAGHSVKFGLGIGFWAMSVVVGGVFELATMTLLTTALFSTYAKTFRSVGAGPGKIDSRRLGRSGGCVNVRFVPVVRSVCCGGGTNIGM